MAYSLAAQSQNNFSEKAEDGYDWGPLAKDTPLSLIREKTLAILGSVLNDDLCFKTESVVGSEALHRDWRGFLAHVNKSVKNRASEGYVKVNLIMYTRSSNSTPFSKHKKRALCKFLKTLCCYTS